MTIDTLKIETQYNHNADTYAKVFDLYNTSSIDRFYSHLPTYFNKTKILDMGCGNGVDLQELKKRGGEAYGVDSSLEMVEIAKVNLPLSDIRHESFASTSFNNQQFDWVISKWALQTYPDIEDVQREIVRILKPGGILLFLVTHPLRQFKEQREYRDYFSNRLVTSKLFENKVVVEEPNHTLAEYISEYFCKNFHIINFEEGIDAGAEVIDEEVYPSFILIKAKKITN